MNKKFPSALVPILVMSYSTSNWLSKIKEFFFHFVLQWRVDSREPDIYFFIFWTRIFPVSSSASSDPPPLVAVVAVRFGILRKSFEGVIHPMPSDIRTAGQVLSSLSSQTFNAVLSSYMHKPLLLMEYSLATEAKAKKKRVKKWSPIPHPPSFHWSMCLVHLSRWPGHILLHLFQSLAGMRFASGQHFCMEYNFKLLL